MGWMTGGGGGDDDDPAPDPTGHIEPSWTKGKGRHDGQWLVRAECGLTPGQWIEVESKSTGRTQRVEIDEVVWEGQGVGLYAVVKRYGRG